MIATFTTTKSLKEVRKKLQKRKRPNEVSSKRKENILSSEIRGMYSVFTKQ
jgi:hypothetical protein